MTRIYLLISTLFLFACEAGNIHAADPSERGLSYVAGAIITAAVIKALCNK